MSVDRRGFLISALAAAASACRRGGPIGGPAGEIEAAIAYLWSQQGADGGFHSSTYGLLASGQSLTPFVLGALVAVPEPLAPRPPGAVGKAIGFIRKHTSADGVLGLAGDAGADYPNYATALALSVLVATRAGGVEPMVSALRSQQFSEANGWGEADAPYGGWGMGGPIRRPPQAGHVDLSMTRTVLEALAAAGVGPDEPVVQRARVYLDRSQNEDGGFYFSTVNPQTNKAGGEAGRFLSYGTATADGLLALRAAGVAQSDSRVVGAIEWLEAFHEPDRAPGLDEGPYAGWDEGLRFYYAGTVARAMPHLPVVLPPAQPDGSYRNSSNLVKEDDPLIATPLAIRALLNVV